MLKFDRRTFFKGLAIMGMGLSGRSWIEQESLWAQTGGAKTGTASQNTKRKYQTFQPGVYFDWEKEMIEERVAIAKKGPQKASPGAAFAPITEDDIIAANKKADPYNPLFNDREYARKAGYPSVPAFPGTQGARGGGASVPAIPKDFGDLWYYHNDGGDNRVYRHVFAGDTFVSEQHTTQLMRNMSISRSYGRMSTSAEVKSCTGRMSRWETCPHLCAQLHIPTMI